MAGRLRLAYASRPLPVGHHRPLSGIAPLEAMAAAGLDDHPVGDLLSRDHSGRLIDVHGTYTLQWAVSDAPMLSTPKMMSRENPTKQPPQIRWKTSAVSAVDAEPRGEHPVEDAPTDGTSMQKCSHGHSCVGAGC